MRIKLLAIALIIISALSGCSPSPGYYEEREKRKTQETQSTIEKEMDERGYYYVNESETKSQSKNTSFSSEIANLTNEEFPIGEYFRVVETKNETLTEDELKTFVKDPLIYDMTTLSSSDTLNSIYTTCRAVKASYSAFNDFDVYFLQNNTTGLIYALQIVRDDEFYNIQIRDFVKN